jgi:hypothetical protein
LLLFAQDEGEEGNEGSHVWEAMTDEDWEEAGNKAAASFASFEVRGHRKSPHVHHA